MSFGKSKSKSTPQFFGPDQILLPEQKEAIKGIVPSLKDSTFQESILPKRGKLLTQARQEIGAGTSAKLDNLRDLFGASGVRGGVQRQDIGDILAADIAASGKATADITGGIEAIRASEIEARRKEKQDKLDRLMAFSLQAPPFAVANASSSRSSNFGII